MFVTSVSMEGADMPAARRRGETIKAPKGVIVVKRGIIASAALFQEEFV